MTTKYDEILFTPREVADLFKVDVKTVGRWAAKGELPCVKTIGGNRRFPVPMVKAISRQGMFPGNRTTAAGVLNYVVDEYFNGDIKAAMTALERLTELAD